VKFADVLESLLQEKSISVIVAKDTDELCLKVLKFLILTQSPFQSWRAKRFDATWVVCSVTLITLLLFAFHPKMFKTPAPRILPSLSKIKASFASSNLNSRTSGAMGISAAKGRNS